MAWRLAEALDQLRDQINAEFPNRRKQSDGTIGDEAHASRSSDHNPWVKDGKMGIVTGLDITHDPGNGVDSYRLAQSLIDNQDTRIKYIISNGKICSGTGQGQPAWKWRGYSGKNPHAHHVHISVKSDKALYDSRKPWKYEMAPKGTKVTESYVPPPATLKLGDKGELVIKLQELLSKKPGFTLASDGSFGRITQGAVKDFQKAHGLVDDGIVGPATWTALGVEK